DSPPTVGHPDHVMPTLSELPSGSPPPADPFATVSPTLNQPPASGPGAAAAARGASPPPTPPVAGSTITGELGRGGLGVVYKATHDALKRDCALKMILSGEFAGPRDCERLLKEAEVFAKLRHPNIVQIFELGRHNEVPYLALELVEGGTLAGRLCRQPCS